MRHIHSRSRFTLAMIGLTAIGSLMLSASVQGELLDDFNDGDDEGWTHFTHFYDPGDPPPMWTVDPDTLVYRLWIDGTAPPFNIVGSLLDSTANPSFQNGYWSATVVCETEVSSSILIVRGDLESLTCYWLGYHQGAHGSDGLCIERVDGGSGVTLAHTDSFVPEVGREYFLEAGTIGPRIELRMWPLGDPRPENPQLEARDCTYPSGVNGVATQTLSGGDLSATFDDVCFEPYTPADIDTDGDVDLTDLGALLAAYGTCDPNDPDPADLDCSGCVDLADLAELLADYGYGP
jgi:hypothetical protein